MTPGLFDVPVLPGLGTRADLIDPAEERMLIDHIDATDLTPFRFQGWTGKRLTTSLGWSYDSRWVDLPRHRPCRLAAPVPRLGSRLC